MPGKTHSCLLQQPPCMQGYETARVSQQSCVQAAGQLQHNIMQQGAPGEAGSSQVASSSPEADEDDSELADVLKRSLEEH